MLNAYWNLQIIIRNHNADSNARIEKNATSVRLWGLVDNPVLIRRPFKQRSKAKARSFA
jgi:hypothetical protein